MEYISDLYASIMSYLDAILMIAQMGTAAVTVASAITALTPTPKDDAVAAKAYKVLEKVAIVVGKAKDV